MNLDFLKEIGKTITPGDLVYAFEKDFEQEVVGVCLEETKRYYRVRWLWDLDFRELEEESEAMYYKTSINLLLSKTRDIN